MSNESAVVSLLERILTLLARFALRNGLKAPMFLDVARVAFISAAKQTLHADGEKINTSRLSVVTGLSRQDLIRHSTELKPTTDGTASVLAKTIGFWRSSAKYSKAGAARPLSVGTKDSEFNALVEHITTNIHPGTVLFELERSGAVKVKNGLARLVRETSRADSLNERAIDLIERGVNLIMSAVPENIASKAAESPHLHIHTVYDNIRSESWPEIHRAIKAEGRSFHRKIRELLSSHDKDINPLPGDDKDSGIRVQVASISYQNETSPEEN